MVKQCISFQIWLFWVSMFVFGGVSLPKMWFLFLAGLGIILQLLRSSNTFHCQTFCQIFQAGSSGWCYFLCKEICTPKTNITIMSHNCWKMMLGRQAFPSIYIYIFFFLKGIFFKKSVCQNSVLEKKTHHHFFTGGGTSLAIFNSQALAQ